MVRIHLLLFFCISSSVFAQQLQVPEIEFQSVSNPLKFPADLYLGEAAGVAVNSKGHIFVLSRGNSTGPAYGAAAAQLLEFDAEGKFLREIGHNLYAWSYAHSVKVDQEDNIWVADKGSDMVIKFSPDGRVAMVFGRKQEASDEKTGPLPHSNPPLPPVNGMFRQVTDMAWTRRATRTSAMAISIRGSRRLTKKVTGLSRGENPETNRGSSALLTALLSMPKTTSSWPTVAIAASRYSTVRESSFGKSRSTCHSIPMPALPLETSLSYRSRDHKQWYRARPGQFASRLRRTRCCLALTHILAAFISSVSRVKFWECWDNPANN
jgi:hypothetical protein